MFSPAKGKAARPKLFDDPELKPAADRLKSLYAERDALRQEWSDLNHSFCLSRQNARGFEQTEREVAALLEGGDVAVLEQDKRPERLGEIDRRINLLERAIQKQHEIVQDVRRAAEIRLRSAVMNQHRSLAERKLQLRREGRKLHQEILAFDRDVLSDTGFGYPLCDLLDASDNHLYVALDSTGERTVSHVLEESIQKYLDESR
jgi:hypothetical protein